MAQNYVQYKIAEIHDEADSIRTFRLRPADGSPLPSYKSGHFFMLRMPSPPPDLKPHFRSYSCLSPPGGSTLDFGIKKHGAFTTLLFGMKAGDAIEVSGPYGLFCLPSPLSSPIVFLAGGIGITPLLCHAHQLVKTSHALPFFLFYSSRHENDMAYKPLIDSLSDLNGNFTPVFTLTGDDVSGEWRGEKGRISVEMVRKHLGSIPLQSCQFYMCGRPDFTTSLTELLKASGVPPENIHKEAW